MVNTLGATKTFRVASKIFFRILKFPSPISIATLKGKTQPQIKAPKKNIKTFYLENSLGKKVFCFFPRSKFISLSTWKMKCFIFFSQKFTAHFLVEVIWKHFLHPRNAVVSARLLFLQNNSLDSIHSSFQHNEFYRSFCFLQFRPRMLMPETELRPALAFKFLESYS